jgi:hypothetical protein
MTRAIYDNIDFSVLSKWKELVWYVCVFGCGFIVFAVYDCRGVDKFFQTLARLTNSSEFSLAKRENNLGSGEAESVR